MKLNYFALSMAAVMVMTLAGCSASRENDNSVSDYPTNSVSSDYDGRASAGVGDDMRNSPDLDDGAYHSDGVGNDRDDEHVGDDYYQNSDSGTDRRPANGDDVVDDIGDAAGDLARGAGNVVRDAGDAIGDAANNIGRAMR